MNRKDVLDNAKDYFSLLQLFISVIVFAIGAAIAWGKNKATLQAIQKSLEQRIGFLVENCKHTRTACQASLVKDLASIRRDFDEHQGGRRPTEWEISAKVSIEKLNKIDERVMQLFDAYRSAMKAQINLSDELTKLENKLDKIGHEQERFHYYVSEKISSSSAERQLIE
jgi:hypothetical protein